MTVSSELDQWVSELQTETGIRATRDPDLVVPPCLFVSSPESVPGPLAGVVVELPIYLIAGGSGKTQVDEMLNHLPTVLNATGQQTANLTTVTIGDSPLSGYLITVPVRLTI